MSVKQSEKGEKLNTITVYRSKDRMVPLPYQYSEPYVASIPESPLKKVEKFKKSDCNVLAID